MSNPHQHGGNGGPGMNDGFEREDLGARTVYMFLFVLAVVGLIVYFAVNVTYRGLNHYYEVHQPAESVLKQTAPGDTRDLQTEKVKEKIENTFPQPLLETDERNELNDFRIQEEKQLNSYGWVDQKAGVVHIPIARAMQLLAERGLPVRSNESNSAGAAKNAVAGGKTSAAEAAKH